MAEVILWLNDWSIDWALAMFAVLWQSTLLALVIGLVTWLMRRGSPAIRFWHWQIVAIKLLLMPFWTIAVPVPWAVPTLLPAEIVVETPNVDSDIGSASRTETGRREGTTPAPEPLETAPTRAFWPPVFWTSWLMIVWAIVVVAQILLVTWQHRWLGKLLKAATPCSSELAARVESCAAKLRLRRHVQVLVREEECSPFVCGNWQAKLVMPRSLVSSAVDGELDAVLMHELVHLQRRDLAWIWIPQAARILYWFHPLTHWLIHRIRLEAELACDGVAMTTSGQDAGDYAKMLVDVMSRLAEPKILRSGPETICMEGGEG